MVELKLTSFNFFTSTIMSLKGYFTSSGDHSSEPKEKANREAKEKLRLAVSPIFENAQRGNLLQLPMSMLSREEVETLISREAEAKSRTVVFISKDTIHTFDPTTVDPTTYPVLYHSDFYYPEKTTEATIHALILRVFAEKGRLIIISNDSFEEFVAKITLHHSGDHLKLASRLRDIFGMASREALHPLNRYLRKLPSLSPDEIQAKLRILNVLLQHLPKQLVPSLREMIEDKFQIVRIDEEGKILLGEGDPSQELQRIHIDLEFLRQNPSIPLENVCCQRDNFVCSSDVHSNLLYGVDQVEPLPEDGSVLLKGTCLIGMNGIGKTHLAIGKAKELMAQGYEVRFVQPQMAEDFIKEIQDLDHVMTHNGKIVWVLDDFNSIAACNEEQRKCFFRVIDLIMKRGGLVIATSNLPIENLATHMTIGMSYTERSECFARFCKIFQNSLQMNEDGRISKDERVRYVTPGVVANPDSAIVVYEPNPLLRSYKKTQEIHFGGKVEKGDQDVVLRLVPSRKTRSLIENLAWEDASMHGVQVQQVLRTAYLEAYHTVGNPLMVEELIDFWETIQKSLQQRCSIPSLANLVALMMNESLSVQMSRYKPRELLSLSVAQLDDILFTRCCEAHHAVGTFLPGRVVLTAKYMDAPLLIELLIQPEEGCDSLSLCPFVKSPTQSCFVVKMPSSSLSKTETAQAILELLQQHYGASQISPWEEFLFRTDHLAYAFALGRRNLENKNKLEFVNVNSSVVEIETALCALNETAADTEQRFSALPEIFQKLEEQKQGLLDIYRWTMYGYLAPHQTFGAMLHREIRDWVALKVSHGEVLQHLTALSRYSAGNGDYPYHLQTTYFDWKGFSGPSPSWAETISAREYAACFSKQDPPIPGQVRKLNLPVTSLRFYRQCFIEGNSKPMYRISAARLFWNAGLGGEKTEKLAFKLDWESFIEEIIEICENRSGCYPNSEAVRGGVYRKVYPVAEEFDLFPGDCTDWISAETGFQGYNAPFTDQLFTKFSDWQAYMQTLIPH